MNSNSSLTENNQNLIESVLCQQHIDEKIQVWCKTCSAVVCSQCALVQHQDHQRVDLETAALAKVKEQQDHIAKIQTVFETKNQQIITKEEHAVIEKITEVFRSIRTILSQHEKNLKKMVLAIEKRQKQAVTNFQRQWQHKQEKFNRRKRDFDDALSGKEYSKILNEHKKSMRYLKSTNRDLQELQCPVPIEYRIDGLESLEQTITDLMQKVTINESKSSSTLSSDKTIVPSNEKKTSEELNLNNFVANDSDTPIVEMTPSLTGPTPIDRQIDTNWYSKRITVAGGNHQGRRVNQLSGPSGIFVDDEQSLYIADFNNHRIVKWRRGAKRGIIIAGGNGKGNGIHQLNRPYDVIYDKKTDSVIISDNGNLRVVRWSCNIRAVSGEILISNIACAGLTMDDDGFLYVADESKHEVRRYGIGEREGTLIAGGHGKGRRLDQLCEPWYLHLSQNRSLYVSDWGNHRVVKWEPGAKQGIVVAGGNGKGNTLAHLTSPEGVYVDSLENVYVADSWNDRIMCWPKGSTEGIVVIGKNRLSCPIGLTLDAEDNMYVVDWGNHRVERFACK